MPSRKKAQGKARKAKQAAKAQSNQNSGFSNGCNHLGERNWRDDDYDAAYSLWKEYRDKYFELARVSDDNLMMAYRLANDVIYDKYHQLSDSRKELFRKILLATGTETCVIEAKEKDLTNVTTVAGTPMPLVLINTIETRDRHDGAFHPNIQLEIVSALNDLSFCSRQTVRFFHRRNYCSCLQDIYYKLKETTKTTSPCLNCRKIDETKQFSRCEYCNIVQYCSFDCALAHWPEHKVECERLGYYKPKKANKNIR
eukprot:scaffold7169_cov76-Cyclotella_meneghiniana.AAC.6